MPTPGSTVVVRATGHWAHPIAGVTVLERVVHAALAAGGRPCVVLSIEPPPGGLAELPGVKWTREEAQAREWAGLEYLLVETESLYDPRLIRWVMDSRPEPGRARTVRLDGRPVLSKIHIGEKALGPAPSLLEQVPKNWLAPVRSPAERDRAYKWLFDRLAGTGDGPLSRWLARPISNLLTRLLWRVPVSAVLFDVLNIAAGTAAALQLAQSGRLAQSSGAALLWLQSVLARCEADLARLKLDRSRLRGAVAFLSVPIVHVAVFGGLGASAAREAAPALAWGLAGLGAVLAGLAAWLGTSPVGQDVESAVGSDPELERFLRLRALGSSGELAYLALAAAAFGKMLWLLVVAAAAALAYVAALAFARSPLAQRASPIPEIESDDQLA